jgi:hypothetical protein
VCEYYRQVRPGIEHVIVGVVRVLEMVAGHSGLGEEGKRSPGGSRFIRRESGGRVEGEWRESGGRAEGERRESGGGRTW